jgi:hypothetical protein
MRFLGVDGRAVCLAAAFLLMAGCVGSQRIQPGAMPQSARTQYGPHKKSGSSGALIYATGGCGGTCVLSYPQGQVVGALDASGSSVCADTGGNVFIPDDNQVFEYAHGGTSPIATLSFSGDNPQGCAVDPTTGNLAVIIQGNSNGNVAVFAGGQGQATLYGANVSPTYCSYDDSGNLLVNGFDNGQTVGLSELPAGGSVFSRLSIPQRVGYPGQIQWDGNYLTWFSSDAGPRMVSRLAISGSQATIVGTTDLQGIKRFANQSWIYGDHMIIPYSNRGRSSKTIGIWRYPKGGKATKGIRHFGSYKESSLRFQGLAISIATSDTSKGQ